MNIVCIIPARGGSKGIPNKNLVELNGLPLVCYSIKQAINSKYISHVYVSSDNKNILETSIKHGAIGIKRPKSLSGDNNSSEEALTHALKVIKNEFKINVDLVIFLQATSPLRTYKDIDKGIKKIIKNKNLASVFSAVDGGDLCLWEQDVNGLKSVNYDWNNRKRRQERSKSIIENGSIYVFKPEVLLKNNNRLGGNFDYFLMDNWKVYEIDEKKDLEIINYFIKKYKL